MQEAPITVLSASSGSVRAVSSVQARTAVSIMPSPDMDVLGGVDTHGRTHHAAAIDGAGRLLGDAEFAATAAGYAVLLAWLTAFGRLVKVGVEGTGTYGAGLARHLAAQDVVVIEVDRRDRQTRRRQGKSDPIDAIAAARAVLAGTATGAPRPAPARWKPSARCGWPAGARSRPAPPPSTSCTGCSSPHPSRCAPS
ncbi:IS110 family transposase [Geodermatophilus obscurus]|uniref:IS110 family transposase n=1 Tax=Geodermatophilus obscurus TaxID=1861 RepID=UPI001FCA86D6|nr:IS110 family transposase [Geodermatophilus obscurus]